MSQRTPLQKNLEAAAVHVETGDVKRALDALVGIRELGFTSRDLERHVGLLREGAGDTAATEKWIAETLVRIREHGDDAFSSAAGAAGVNDASVDDLFGDLGEMFAGSLFDRDEPTRHGSDAGSAPNLGDRLRLTSNKFKIPAPKDREGELKDTRPGDDDKPAGKQTKPFQEPYRPSGYDSGLSGARYAPGVEVEPPVHRLKTGANLAVTPAEPPAAAPEPDAFDDLDFDLGFAAPSPAFAPAPAAASPAAPSVSPARAVEDDDAFDFDLGLESPAPSFGAGAGSESSAGQELKPSTLSPLSGRPMVDQDALSTRPGDSEAQHVKQTPSRESAPTPLAPALYDKSEPIDEDEFFELAESMASEASMSRESVGRGRFGASGLDQATGVGEAHEYSELGSPASSVVGPVTNLSAILLEARRIFESGDYDAALDICSKIISRSRGNAEAEQLREQIEAAMSKAVSQRLGSLDQVPRLKIAPNAIATLNLDHRAGFLLSLIDGYSTYEDLLDLASMPREEALAMFARLLKVGAISAD